MKLSPFIYKLSFCMLLIALQISSPAQLKSNKVSLRGTLKNFNNQVEVEDMSAFQYLLPSSSNRVIIPDSAGNFSASFAISQPSYFRLGRNQLYLSPSDDLELFVDKSNPKLARFTGKGSEANMYLRQTPFPKGGSYIEAGGLVKATPDETVKAVQNAATVRSKQLDSVKGVSAEFRRLETARIKADLINSLIMGETYSTMRLRLKGDSAKLFSTEYKKAIQPAFAQNSKNFIDASLMQLVVYRDIAEDILSEPGPEKDKQKIRDWYAASALVGEMRKISDKDLLKAYEPKVVAIKTVDYKNAVKASLASLLKFGKGDEARSFIAADLDGKKISLQSLKGKVVYLDLWATWCGPCLAEMPHYEELKAKYKDNNNIVFVSLSIDDTETPWKKNVETRKADGYQWIINRNALADYEIVSIPRTIVIDKNFKIADLNAPLPSDKTTIPMIEGLLK